MWARFEIQSTTVKTQKKTKFFLFEYKKIAILRNMLSIENYVILLVAMSSKEL